MVSDGHLHKIIEYAELEGTHKDHQVQLLVSFRTLQESHHVPKSIVETLLELCQAGAVPQLRAEQDNPSLARL